MLSEIGMAGIVHVVIPTMLHMHLPLCKMNQCHSQRLAILFVSVVIKVEMPSLFDCGSEYLCNA